MNGLDIILRSNPHFVENLFRQYRHDPSSVPATWAAFFAGWEMGAQDAGAQDAGAMHHARAMQVRPASARLRPAADGSPIVLTSSGDLPEGIDAASLEPGLRIYDVVHAFRAHGHLIADLDPLGFSPRTDPLLELSEFGFTETDLDTVVRCEIFKGLREGTVREFIDALRATYCGSIGVEYLDVLPKEARDWMQEQMEPCRNRASLSPEQRREILRHVLTADTFEESLGRMFPGSKRFSLEGGTSLVALLLALIDAAADSGVEHVVMGMAHRGRLNVLAHVLGKPHEHILAEFEGRPLPPEASGHGDVKYHLGLSRVRESSSGKPIHLSLEFNPSHLEAVNPVVEGIVRAKQNRLGDTRRERVVPVLMHGDAAMIGQGIVAETLMLAGLPGYTTGGTVHVIVNNQVGFTTDPAEARSTRYASDIVRIAGAPVIHVNGDDPEACCHAARLALAFRQRFHRDICIDLSCYRRHGHNELDDPTFTQPVMYSAIQKHPSNSRLHASRLVAEGIVTEPEVEAMRAEVVQQLETAHVMARSMPVQVIEKPGEEWRGFGPAGADWSADTRVPRASLQIIARALTVVPAGFTWHARLKKLMERRAAMVLAAAPGAAQIDWGCAEALAIGALLLEGTKVRLSGQDSGRGTFSHRHAIYSDAKTGERYVPLNHLASEQNVFQVFNSPLSEAAVLGFEYGYTTTDPLTLVLWEAQFGDFINGAQVIVDQLIASCELKWGRMSGLVLLLPHGHEGQGPEHSSARLERFLELCADDNMQVMNLSTPAQYFHALRRQMKRKFRKPLVLMAPKSLLRHELAVSSVEDLERGTFQEIIDDEVNAKRREGVKRLLLCSGKVYYALQQERLKRQAGGDAADVALVRVEQLYPFPAKELVAIFATYPRLTRVTWVQEEPQNMGAWRNLRHRLEKIMPEGLSLTYAGRHSAAVPATGSFEVHVEEERRFIEAAFTAAGETLPKPTVVEPGR